MDALDIHIKCLNEAYATSSSCPWPSVAVLIDEVERLRDVEAEYERRGKVNRALKTVLNKEREEVRRLESILSTLGFCPKDGDAMPCTTCGAGL